MAGTPILTPPVFEIQGGNWFHHGWLYGAMGLPLPKWNNWDHPVRDIDVDAFQEGYATASGTLGSLLRELRNRDAIVVKVNTIL